MSSLKLRPLIHASGLCRELGGFSSGGACVGEKLPNRPQKGRPRSCCSQAHAGPSDPSSAAR
jgi:hypothetical protein